MFNTKEGHNEQNFTTWKELILIEMEKYNETLDDIISNTMSEEEMNKEFDNEWGGNSAYYFTIWSKTRIYFSAVNDGVFNLVESISRNPNNKAILCCGCIIEE